MTQLLLAAVSAVIHLAGPDPNVRPNTRVTDCTESGCHTEVIASRYLHAPVSTGECSACHTSLDVEEHTFTLKHTGAALCEFCHIEKTAGMKLHVHEPVAEGKCLECHLPHGAPVRALLNAPSVAENCRECHEDVPETEGSILHTPVGEGNCLGCHDAHWSSHAGLLVDEGRGLCLRCHGDTALHAPAQSWYAPGAGAMADRGGAWRISGPPLESWDTSKPGGPTLPLFAVVHEPVREGCADCHSHHASDVPGLLTDSPLLLCGSCHEDVLGVADEASVKHSAVTEDRACLHCHSAHQSAIPGLMADSALEICAECHSEPAIRSDGKEIRWVALARSPGSSIHGPLRHDCSVCHEVHGGALRALLERPYTKEFYGSTDTRDFALCLSCHDEKLIEAERTRSATAFRNGTLNLHHVHVKDPGLEGRSCRVCHSAHAARGPRLVHENVAFGKWTLPIGLELTETGGSCAAGCHRASRYDRVKAIAEPILPKPGADGGGLPGL